jgi:hypothetical protein
MKAFSVLLWLVSGASIGCGAGPYGHSRVYAALDAEQAALAGAEELDPVMAKRQPEAWAKKTVSVFGVVIKREEGGDKKGNLTLSVRALEPRNLCETVSEDSCRVTVTDREFDRVHARITLVDPNDEIGPASIGPGSLVRVVGKLAPTVNPGDGAQVIVARYYRHWPRGYYVTSSAAGLMRK